MKKIILTACIFTLLGTVSCRTHDDMISPEDTANLEVMENSAVARDSVFVQDSKTVLLPGDPVPPPKK